MPILLETIIGLEVHAQMNTQTKLFCGCRNDSFGKLPNTAVCPVCMGHPGALPVPNTEAVRKALCAARALQCRVEPSNHLDRKNYFYPDLPAGYQISQYDFPLARDGAVAYGPSGHCRILRLHIENDAGKLTHVRGRTLCDFNRAGVPLMEIVTQPDLRAAWDAAAFARELQRILITVGASDDDMEKGMLRFDASISLRPHREEKLYPRAEIKNLNSFRSLERALTCEEQRLRALWEQDTPPTHEVTVHWDDERGEGVILRDKESAADYRYFPEPDIPPFTLHEAFLTEVGMGEVELPQEKRGRYLAAGLIESEANLLIDMPALANFYEQVAAASDFKRAASVVLHQLPGFLKGAGKSLEEGPSPGSVIALLKMADRGEVALHMVKQVLEEMVVTGKEAKEVIAGKNVEVVANAAALEKSVRRAIAANPAALKDFRDGKTKAAGAIVGFVMKETGGRADPQLVRGILERLACEGMKG